MHRIIALPLAFWFVVLATDVGGVDGCPMHDAMAHGAAAAMASMAMPGMTQAPAAPAVPAPQGPMHCTCLGVCCGCAMATLPSTPAVSLPTAVALHQTVRIERAGRPLAAAARFVLPPSIGPPALHA